MPPMSERKSAAPTKSVLRFSSVAGITRLLLLSTCLPSSSGQLESRPLEGEGIKDKSQILGLSAPSQRACPLGTTVCPGTQGSTPPKCYTAQQTCDGTPNCPGAGDEKDCPCRRRVESSYRCDQYQDCPDGDDERGCGGCAPDALSCFPADGSERARCLSPQQLCDGVQDCLDQTDEQCFRLVNNPEELQGPRGWLTEGFLQQRTQGQWRPVCSLLFQTVDTAAAIRKVCSGVVGEDRVGRDIHNATQYVFKNKQLCVSSTVFRVRCAPPTCHSQLDVESLRRSEDSSVTRIVGGVTAPEGSWPSIISLLKNGEHDCGGTVLTKRYIMVAAHCMRFSERHHFEVRVGLSRRSTFAGTVQVSEVDTIFPHPNFSARQLSNDIAILKLKTDLQLNRWVRPVCLPSLDRIWQDGNECAVAGWGFVRPRTSTVDRLQQALVPIYNLKECQSEYNAERIPQPQQVLCAGLVQGGRDACSGDSGGPMMCRVCRNKDCSRNEWTQDGIVSYGKGCAEAHTPGVYTRVQYYLPWIQRVLAIENGNYSDGEVIRMMGRAASTCQRPWNGSLPLHRVCDGKVDCLEADDEIDFPICPGKNVTLSNVFTPPPPINSFLPAVPVAPEVADAAIPTPPPVPTNTSQCPIDTFKCSGFSEVQCVKLSQMCDGSLNCRDGTDEQHCSCLLRLFAASKRLVCDGVPDCPDGDDEAAWLCPDAGLRRCSQHNRSYNSSQRCDQVLDCIHGDDEVGCVSLATNESALLLDADGVPLRQRQGFLAVRGREEAFYNPICSEAVPAETLNQICHFLGFENHVNVKYISSLSSTKYAVKNEARSATDALWHLNTDHLVSSDLLKQKSLALNDAREPSSSGNSMNASLGRVSGVSPHGPVLSLIRRRRQALVKQPNDTCSQVQLTCGALRCGLVPKILEGLSSYTGVGAQPWAVGVYQGGRYLCGGTLVHPQWVVTSQECVSKLRFVSGSLHVVGGSHRGPFNTLRVRNPFERESAVLQTQEGLGGLLLMYLQRPLPTTSRINPICLPTSAPSWPGPWLQCAMVGYDGDRLTRTLLLTPKTDCPAGQACFSPYLFDGDTNCPGAWSGLLTCLNSTRASAQWVAVGVWTYDGAGCTRPTAHPLLDASLLISLKLGMKLPSSPAPSPCLGLQCSFGRCVPPEGVCDGHPDCADFTDEPDTCPPPAMRCRPSGGPVLCPCPVGFSPCWNGTCLPDVRFCDGSPECNFGEDEKNCSCTQNLRAERPLALCDGVIDCDGGDDERHCGCDEEREARCHRSGNRRGCIPLISVCDGEPQCPGGEDEEHCSALLPLPDLLSAQEVASASLLTVDLNPLGIAKASSNGLLLVRLRGHWYSYAYDAWSHQFSKKLCAQLGYSAANTTIRLLRLSSDVGDRTATASRSVQGVFRAASGGEEVRAEVVYIRCNNGTKTP